MPQLDQTLIFNQIFWFIFVFIFVYVIFICFFLPTLLKIFKSRNYIYNNNFNEIKQINCVLNEIKKFQVKNAIKCVQTFKNLLLDQLFFKKTQIVHTKYISLQIINPISHKLLYSKFSNLFKLLKIN